MMIPQENNYCVEKAQKSMRVSTGFPTLLIDSCHQVGQGTIFDFELWLKSHACLALWIVMPAPSCTTEPLRVDHLR